MKIFNNNYIDFFYFEYKYFNTRMILVFILFLVIIVITLILSIVDHLQENMIDDIETILDYNEK
jgi:hypothetical protein